jgi:uncharacterized protein (DUF111 family)
MHIGAMLDLGVPEQALRDALARLQMADEFELEVTRDARMGISGTRATVHLKSPPAHHRHLADVREIIQRAAYSAAVERTALGIFQRIAEAEALIHDMPVEKVHFHEVGATGAHGMMPVPAPATAEILSGVPCRYDGVDQEATTPTGAAILREAVHAFHMPGGFVTERIGYGIGQKSFDIPNVARVLLGTLTGSDTQEAEPTVITELNQEIHANIDDMPAEAFQPLLERLLAAGARDVYLTPVIMKKARPGTKVSVLCAPQQSNLLQSILFQHSTTIGVRAHDVEKRMLPRTERRLTTSLGEVGVKIVTLPDGGSRWKLEHDDVARIAREQDGDYLAINRTLGEEVKRLLADLTSRDGS